MGSHKQHKSIERSLRKELLRMHLLRYSYTNSSVHDIINTAEEVALTSSDYPCLACAAARSPNVSVKLFTGLYLLESHDVVSKLEALVTDAKVLQTARRDVMWYKTFEGSGDVVRKVSVSGGSIISGIESSGKVDPYRSTSPAPSIVSSNSTSSSSFSSFLKRSPSQRFKRRFSLVSWNE